MPLTAPYEPVELTDADRAFPAHALDWMPAEDDIPDEWYRDGHWASRLWNAIFAKGLEDIQLDPVEGIDPERAWKHLNAIFGSYAPRHQHKMAALGYLTNLWFKGVEWKTHPMDMGPWGTAPATEGSGGTFAEVSD